MWVGPKIALEQVDRALRTMKVPLTNTKVQLFRFQVSGGIDLKERDK